MRLLSLLLVAASACAQSGGWLDLFPDARFTGWTRIAIPPTHAPSNVPQWHVDTGHRLVICDGNGGHDMMRYDRQFGDFILHVEWRFPKVEGETKYNSGVFVRNNADGSIWHQAQAGLGGGYIFGNTLVHGVPQRINLRPEMRENRVKPAGEWNTYEITCQGRNISLAVNGAVVSEFTQCEVPRGYIGLEAEGYQVEFRHLRLKQLP